MFTLYHFKLKIKILYYLLVRKIHPLLTLGGNHEITQAGEEGGTGRCNYRLPSQFYPIREGVCVKNRNSSIETH